MSFKELDFKVFYSPDDQAYVAICDQFPSLSAIEANWYTAIKEIIKLVKEAIEEIEEIKL